MAATTVRWARAAAAAAMWLAKASRAEAEENDAREGLTWDSRWPRVRPVEYAATGATIAGVGVGLFAVPQRVDEWQGGILFDDWLRERLVLGNLDDRTTARHVGDSFYWAMSLYPMVVDVGVAALAVHQSPDVAWQMFAIDAQSFALTGLLSTYTQRLIGRNRPFVDRCAADPSYDPDCDDPASRSQALLSGHTAMAFTGAGLVCAHHAHLELYGGGAADVVACATGLAGATVVAMSRIVGDRHYATDALAGATVGLASGYLLPELLHYRFAPSFRLGGATGHAAIVPLATSERIGLAVSGQY